MARPAFHDRTSALFGCLVAAALARPAAPAAAATGGDEQEANYLVVVDPAKVSTAAAPGVLAANGFRVDARASQKVSKLGIVAGRTTRGNAKRLRSLPGVQVGANRRVQSMGEPVA